MRWEFTVVAPAGKTDVAVTAPVDAAADDIAAAVRRAAALCGVRLPAGGAAHPRTGALVDPRTAAPVAPAAGLSVFVAGGRCAGLTRPLPYGRFVIGRAADCDLRLDDDRVSRYHAQVEVGRRRVTVRDLASSNGTELDGVAVRATPVDFEPGQLLHVGDSLLGLRHAAAEPRAAVTQLADATLVGRSPRREPPPAAAPIDLPPPVRPHAQRRVGIAAAVLPAALGGAVAWLTGSLVFLLFSALTPLLLLCGALGERWHWRRSRRRDDARRRRALARCRADVARALAAEVTHLRDCSPDAAHVEVMAALPAPRLWQRVPADADYLRLRLGTAALPSSTLVRCGGSESAAGLIHAAPLCIDLRAGPVGICGPAEVTRALARWLVAQLAVHLSPACLRLALALPGDDEPWKWARWLPHLEHRVACSPDGITALAAQLSRYPSSPALVLVVDGAGEVAGRLPGALVNDSALSAVFLAAEPAQLPPHCRHVVVARDPAGSRAVLTRTSVDRLAGTDFVVDQVSVGWAERVARALAPLRDGTTPGGRAPTSPALTELMGLSRPMAEAVRALWAASDGTPATPLGDTPDGPLRLDLAADGPHCLVAGTTGSGKSELLRTLVTGLALGCPPTDLAFVLIDYKGGAAFAECADLPHTVGVVTDLDARLTRRALRSLDAELRRRERLLAGVGAVDLPAFRRARPDEPLPRLIVVVDEFATLAEELPGFLSGLVAVAQRGRSLGLHLVLATQRPGRAVSPEIKANTSARIALRVTDTAESLDIIDAPDAASIPAAAAGCGYLRRGERVTAFRAAVARAGPGDAVRVEVLGPWRRPLGADACGETTSALREIVAAVRAAAEQAGCPPAASPWQPPLPEVLADTAADADADRDAGPPPTRIPLGVVDLPDQQRHAPLTLDLAAAQPVLLCGAAGSGRTTALLGAAVRAARAWSPAYLEIYAVDRTGALGTRLRKLPHLATAASAGGEPAAIGVLLRRLTAPTTSRARRLLLVDDWDSVLSTVGDTAAARLNELMGNLVRTATEHNLTVLVTGDRGLLAGRLAATAGNRLLLRLADRADYALAGLHPRDVPATLPPGRGLRAADGAEFQLFAPMPATSGGPAREADAIARRWTHTPPSRSAVRLRRLPDRVSLAQCATPPSGISVGVGGDEAVPLAFDPLRNGHLLVAGPPRSGRSTTLVTLLAECERTGIAVVVAAPRRSPLREHAVARGVRVIDSDERSGAVGLAPATAAVLLVDDAEVFDDTAAGEELVGWLRNRQLPLTAVVAGRTDELATAYRGLGAEARRNRCGLLLRPAGLDGELFGVRLERGDPATTHPGRGLLIGLRYLAGPQPAEPGAEWLPLPCVEPVPVQVALSPWSASPTAQSAPPAMCGYR